MNRTVFLEYSFKMMPVQNVRGGRFSVDMKLYRFDFSNRIFTITIYSTANLCSYHVYIQLIYIYKYTYTPIDVQNMNYKNSPTIYSTSGP